jgi:hypothetical protein
MFRQKSVTAQSAVMLGLHIPRHAALPDGWIEQWRRRVAREQQKMLPLYTHAERRSEGGVVIVRHGTRLRQHLDELLGDVRDSLESFDEESTGID